MLTAVMAYLFHASDCAGLYTTGFASIKKVRECLENMNVDREGRLREERPFVRRML